MNSSDILDAVGMVDDKLIRNAKEKPMSTKKRLGIALSAIAACLALILFIPNVYERNNGSDGGFAGQPPGAVPPTNVPPTETATFDFQSYDELSKAFITLENGVGGCSENNIHANKHKLGERFNSLIELIERKQAVAVPTFGGVPMELRNKEGFNNITVMSNEAYNMPWIWYHCLYEGRDVTVRITYPSVADVIIDPEADFSEILRSIDRDAVNTHNYRDYPNYKNVYTKELEVSNQTVSALVFEYKNSDKTTVMFCLGDVLVSVNADMSEAGGIDDSFFESFSVD